MRKNVERVRFIVVTDLDACLLDETYSWDAARHAIRTLRLTGHSLVLNSSKTLPEMRQIAIELETCSAIVGENGSVVTPRGPDGMFSDAQTLGGSPFDMGDLQEELFILREELGLNFQTHRELGAEGFADVTGLSIEQARLAIDRIGTVPLLVSSEEAKAELVNVLNDNLVGYQATSGGRFVHVAPAGTNKAEGLRVVVNAYREEYPRDTVFSVALGDSDNDFEMLKAADIRVAIKNPNSGHSLRDKLEADGLRVISNDQFGPVAWNTHMQRLVQSVEGYVKPQPKANAPLIDRLYSPAAYPSR